MLRIELVQAENDKLRLLLKQAYNILSKLMPGGEIDMQELTEVMVALKLNMETHVPPETPKSQRIFGG